MYDNRFTGEFPVAPTFDMEALAEILPERMGAVADEHRGLALDLAAVWILSDGILRVVLHVTVVDGEQGVERTPGEALLGYDVVARQLLATFPSSSERDLAGLFVWEYLAGDCLREHVGVAEPGMIHWVESVIDIPRPSTLEQVAQIPGAWTRPHHAT